MGKIALMSFSILLTCLMSNLILHYTYMEHLYYRPHDRFNKVSHAQPLELHHYNPNTQYSGWAYGDLAAQSGYLEGKETKFVEFIIDELGFRNPIGQKNKRNDIIIIGDSFGVGTGTTQDSTPAYLLAQLTHKEIYNLSYPAMPFMELTRLALEIDDIQKTSSPTLLWFIFAGNDLEECPENYPLFLQHIENDVSFPNLFKTHLLQDLKLRLANYYRKAPLRGIIKRAFYHSEKNNQVITQTLASGKTIYFRRDYIKSIQQSQEAINHHPSFDCFKQSIRTGKLFAEQQGLALKMIYIPCKYEIYASFADGKKEWFPPPYPSGFNRTFRDLMNELGIDYVDVTPHFIDEAERLWKEKKKILWWRDDTHLNSKGNELLAKVIAKHFFKT